MRHKWSGILSCFSDYQSRLEYQWLQQSEFGLHRMLYTCDIMGTFGGVMVNKLD